MAGNVAIVVSKSMIFLGSLIKEYLENEEQCHQVFMDIWDCLFEMIPEGLAISHFILFFNGREARTDLVVRRIRDRDPAAVIIVICSVSICSPEIRLLLQEGANAVLGKEAGMDELKTSMRFAQGKETFLCKRLFKHIIQEVSTPTLERLITDREAQVLQMMLQGCNTRETANIMQLSLQTVRACKRGLMKKLDVQSTDRLLCKAWEMGLA